MEYESRPHLHALVAFVDPDFGIIRTDPKMMPLEDAVDFARYGFVILLDPQDEQDLAMWERLQRALAQPKRRAWYARD